MFRKETKVRITNADDLFGYSGGVSVSAGGGGAEGANDFVIGTDNDDISSVDPSAMDVSDG